MGSRVTSPRRAEFHRLQLRSNLGQRLKKLHELPLKKMHQADLIEWRRASLDSGSVRAVGGGNKRVPIPQIDASWAPNITWLQMVEELLLGSN